MRFLTTRENLIKMAWAAYRHGMAVGKGLDLEMIDKLRLEKIQAELNCQSIEVPDWATHVAAGPIIDRDHDVEVERLKEIEPERSSLIEEAKRLTAEMKKMIAEDETK